MKCFLLILTVFAFLSGCDAPYPEPSATPASISPDAIIAETAPEFPADTDPYGNPVTWDINSSNFPLYAMIQSEDIYLYGVKPHGMILYQDGKGTYFNWPGLIRSALPELLYHDLDGDGKKELAVILHFFGGLHLYSRDLHVLSIEESQEDWAKPTYIDHALLAENVHDWMTVNFSTSTDDNNSFQVDVLGNSYFVEGVFAPGDPDYGQFKGITFGYIVDFSFVDGRIRTNIAIGALCGPPIPYYFGEIEAYVVFDGENLKLEEYTFTMDEN